MNINKTISAKKLLSLPIDIQEIAKENEYVNLISEEVISKLYTLDMRNELFEYMKHFNNLKYFYNSTTDYSVKSTNFTNSLKTKSSSKKSNVEQVVDKKVDDDLWLEEAYYHIVSLAHKINRSEQVYFVETFFRNSSEEAISEKLGICRKTLQHIKKSCLIKLYIETH